MNGDTVFVIIIILVLILSILFVFKDSVEDIYIGILKNKRIRRYFKKYVNKNDYLYLYDLCLRIAEGKYLYVDHLILGDRFIYAISTKFYYGFLTGKDIDEKWVLSDGKTTQIVDNPLLVNEFKLKYLSRIMEVDVDNLVNIVLLSKTCKVDSIEISNPNYNLCEEDTVLNIIQRHESDSRYNVFLASDLEQKANELYEYHKASIEDRRATKRK